MAERCDIVELINKNPLVRLSQNVYQSKILNKIKERCTERQQRIFSSNHYLFLNYTKKDFVIDLDDAWKWLGFGRKSDAKRALEKNFKKDIDFVCNAEVARVNTDYVGKQKERILMNRITFMKFCMKSNTKVADEIHDYFIILEEITHEIVEEDTNELRQQLQIKDSESNELRERLMDQHEHSENEKQTLLEQTLCESFPENTECIYYGSIEDTNFDNESLVKFGRTNYLSKRIKKHKKVFTNFKLIKAYKVTNNLEIENIIKTILKNKIRKLTISGVNYTELLLYDSNTDSDIKQILIDNEYNLENYKLIIKKNEQLIETNEFLIVENEELRKKLLKFEFENNTRTEYFLVEHYRNFVKDCIVTETSSKLSLLTIIEYFEKYITKNNIISLMPTHTDDNNLKLYFKNEIKSYIEKFTDTQSTLLLSNVDSVKNIQMSKVIGWIGLKIKDENIVQCFSENVYNSFIREKLTKTNDENDIIQVKTVLDIFVDWIKTNGHVPNRKIYSKHKQNLGRAFKSEFVLKLVEKLECLLVKRSMCNTLCYIALIEDKKR
jgi:hypothetical protein